MSPPSCSSSPRTGVGAPLGWFAVLVLWGRRVTPLVAVFAAEAAIALVAVFAHGAGNAAGLSRYAMYVYGTATLPIAFSVAAGVLRTLAARTAGTAAARAALEAERIAAQRAQVERQERLSLVSQTAGVILAELADGRADPTDPAVQRRCALEAARLRRLIAESDDVPDPLLHELRAAVDIAERNGLPVELVSVGTLPVLPVHVRRQAGRTTHRDPRLRPTVGPADRGGPAGRGRGQSDHPWHGAGPARPGSTPDR